MKFKILQKVTAFTDSNGVVHLPGEIVDLSESYRGETWLEEVIEIKKEEIKVANTDAVKEVVDKEEKAPAKVETKEKETKTKRREK